MQDAFSTEKTETYKNRPGATNTRTAEGGLCYQHRRPNANCQSAKIRHLCALLVIPRGGASRHQSERRNQQKPRWGEETKKSKYHRRRTACWRPPALTAAPASASTSMARPTGRSTSRSWSTPDGDRAHLPRGGGRMGGLPLPPAGAQHPEGYRPALRRAIDEFGEDPIQKITARDIKTFLVAFAVVGERGKRSPHSCWSSTSSVPTPSKKARIWC